MHFLELKIPPAALLIICIAGMLSAQVYLPLMPLNLWIKWGLTGVLLSGALIIIMLAVWHFRQHTTTVNPMQPEQTKQLLTNGVMQYTRNPMYLGFLMLIIATGIAMQSYIFPIVSLVFITWITRFQIIPEERALNALFPIEFIQYCKTTRRWI